MAPLCTVSSSPRSVKLALERPGHQPRHLELVQWGEEPYPLSSVRLRPPQGIWGVWMPMARAAEASRSCWRCPGRGQTADRVQIPGQLRWLETAASTMFRAPRLGPIGVRQWKRYGVHGKDLVSNAGVRGLGCCGPNPLGQQVRTRQTDPRLPRVVGTNKGCWAAQTKQSSMTAWGRGILAWNPSPGVTVHQGRAPKITPSPCQPRAHSGAEEQRPLPRGATPVFRGDRHPSIRETLPLSSHLPTYTPPRLCFFTDLGFFLDARLS